MQEVLLPIFTFPVNFYPKLMYIFKDSHLSDHPLDWWKWSLGCMVQIDGWLSSMFQWWIEFYLI